MLTADYIPHIKLILEALRVNPERLNSKSKVAIDTRLLRTLLQVAVAKLPFSAEFYRTAYPDLAAAQNDGQIEDLRAHYIETGYFEGRLGAAPVVDEAFYASTYPDVATAVKRGDIASATEHYVTAGAAEGRIPNPDLKQVISFWNAVLGDETRSTR